MADVTEAAKTLGTQLKIVEAGPPEIEHAFGTLHTARVAAVLVLGGAGFYLMRDQIVGDA